MGTSVDDGKAREKDLTRLPVPNLPLCHWSSQLFNLRAPSSTDVPVLLLNQPITKTGLKFCTNKLDHVKIEIMTLFLQGDFISTLFCHKQMQAIDYISSY